MLRFPRRIAARFGAVVRADPSGVRAGFGALLISSGGDLVAGVTLASINHTLLELPALFVLIPAAIGMRGNVFGALGSRLGTLIHTGEFRVSRRLDTPVGQNIAAALVLSLSTSFALAVLAKAVAVAFNVKSISIIDFMVVAVVGALLSSLVVLAITIGVASQCAKRRWDLDNVAAPIVTAAGDVATLPSLFAATYLLGIRVSSSKGPAEVHRGVFHVVTPIIAILCAIACVVALVAALRSGLPTLQRIVVESAPILVMAGLVDVLAGVTIEKRTAAFFALPALSVLIPPFLEDSGALGGILSARVSTRLHLGTLASGKSPLAALDDILLVLVYAVPTFVLLGVSADVAANVTHFHGPGLLKMVEVSVLGGTMATVFAVVIGFYAAVFTHRLGLDPDNHGIAIVTSSLDLFGAFSLILAIVLLGLH
jgi:mgtE-like transporter